MVKQKVLVAVWTAAQVLKHYIRTLPEKPEVDSKGLRMEIVYPAQIFLLQ